MTNNPDGLSDAPFTPREVVAAMLLEHDAGGITMATLRDARMLLATPPASTSTAIAAGEVLAKVVGWHKPLTNDIAMHITVTQCLEAMRQYAAAAPQAASEDEPRYLIRKGGYYYRPNAHGYTSHAAEAGRYTLAEAIKHSHPNGPDGPRDGMDYVLDTTPKAASEDGATGLIEGVKRVLQNPNGEHDGWTDHGLKHAFFRWPAIVHAINVALAASPTDTTGAGVMRERCAKVAENPGFVEARDTEWDAGFNYAKRYIAAAIRNLPVAGETL